MDKQGPVMISDPISSQLFPGSEITKLLIPNVVYSSERKAFDDGFDKPKWEIKPPHVEK
jgi:hypothetical protein